MKRWLKRIRGAVLMGLTWALVWAPVAVLLGLAIDPDGSMDEMWPAIGAYPGFLGGVVFSVVLAVAARDRRIEELSVRRFAAWGALAGFLVGVLPFLIGDASTAIPEWLLALLVIGTITLLSAVSAAGSLAIARRGETSELLPRTAMPEARVTRARRGRHGAEEVRMPVQPRDGPSGHRMLTRGLRDTK